MTNDDEHLFMCLVSLCSCVSFLCVCMFSKNKNKNQKNQNCVLLCTLSQDLTEEIKGRQRREENYYMRLILPWFNSDHK